MLPGFLLSGDDPHFEFDNDEESRAFMEDGQYQQISRRRNRSVAQGGRVKFTVVGIYSDGTSSFVEAFEAADVQEAVSLGLKTMFEEDSDALIVAAFEGDHMDILPEVYHP